VAEISAKAVKELREQTGAGMMDCKRALSEADGELKKAVEVLRERGLAKAGKREGRATSEGVIAVALAGPVGGMVELGCETDFVARTDDFIALGDAFAKIVTDDRAITSPEKLQQASLDGQTVAERISAAIAKLGENVELKRVARIDVEKGLAGGYVHAGGKLGVLVGIATDKSGADVEALAKDISMHVAAADPSPVAVTRDGVSQELLAEEREIYRKQALQEGKPEKVIDRIVDGKLNKFLSEISLVDQPFVKDPDKTVGGLLDGVGDVSIVGFARFKLGEKTGEEAGEE
jgi:elongation factor Ts